ncbi:MAG TPA: hypothetical protein VJU77_00600 [Chthoniobacterales bacterium]|nr:hypothetical protein [Chthoniobacterales bacterium]
MNAFVVRRVVCFCLWPVLVFAGKQTDQAIVEIKSLVPENKITEFSTKLALGSKVPLTRTVCFFDTESLSLFRHSPRVILRSRYDASGGSDTTVKIRDGKAQGNNADCEFDAVLGKKRTLSCSVTDKGQKRGEIKKANEGKDVKKVFSKQQEATLENAFGKVKWRELRPFGPVKEIKVWKELKLPGGPSLTVERWKLPGGPSKPARVFFEVSAKVPLADEARTSKWIASLVGVSEHGNDQESETKTQIVLEHFSQPRRTN